MHGYSKLSTRSANELLENLATLMLRVDARDFWYATNSRSKINCLNKTYVTLPQNVQQCHTTYLTTKYSYYCDEQLFYQQLQDNP